jgi:hypothetical protein
MYTKVKDEWIKIIRKSLNDEVWFPTLNSYVCSRHFLDKDYSGSAVSKILVPNAIPSVNLGLVQQSDDITFELPLIEQIEIPPSLTVQGLFVSGNYTFAFICKVNYNKILLY